MGASLRRVLVVVGTRPEAIKLAPLIRSLKRDSYFDVKVCHTGQHTDLVAPIFSLFDIIPDFSLTIMSVGQRPIDVLTRAISGIDRIIQNEKPDIVCVQGDTTSALAGGLAAAYNKIVCAHVEAGLRSFSKENPFPEEYNRVLLGDLATIHFAPTQRAVDALALEGITQHVYLVGNTVVDALQFIVGSFSSEHRCDAHAFFEAQGIKFDRPIVALTFHRRESFGLPFEQFCQGIQRIAKLYPDYQFVFPVHPNPAIYEPAHRMLRDIGSAVLISPLSYPYMLFLLEQSSLVMTDSGGIVEEAPSLNTPVLILREKTERQDAVDAGMAVLVSPNSDSIVATFSKWHEGQLFTDFSKSNPFGDGQASLRICDVFLNL